MSPSCLHFTGCTLGQQRGPLFTPSTLPGILACTCWGGEVRQRKQACFLPRFRALATPRFWREPLFASRYCGLLQKSRDPQRTPMQWTTDNFAGFTDGELPWLPVNGDFVDRNVKVGKDLQHFRKPSLLYDLILKPSLLYDLILFDGWFSCEAN